MKHESVCRLFEACFVLTLILLSQNGFGQVSTKLDANELSNRLKQERTKIHSFETWGQIHQVWRKPLITPGMIARNKSLERVAKQNNDSRKYFYSAFVDDFYQYSTSTSPLVAEAVPSQPPVRLFTGAAGNEFLTPNQMYHVQITNPSTILVTTRKHNQEQGSVPNSITYGGFPVGKVNLWLDELLLSKKFVVSHQEKHKLFGTVIVCNGSITNEAVLNSMVKIAPQYGYRIVDYSLRESNGDIIIREIKKLIKVDSMWVPSSIREVSYNSKGVTLLEQYAVYNKIVLNKIQKQNLQFHIPVGAVVTDEENRNYKIGSDNSRIYLANTPSIEEKSKWPGWLFTASMGTLLVLTVFAYVRWKQKQRAKRARGNKSPSEL